MRDLAADAGECLIRVSHLYLAYGGTDDGHHPLKCHCCMQRTLVSASAFTSAASLRVLKQISGRGKKNLY